MTLQSRINKGITKTITGNKICGNIKNFQQELHIIERLVSITIFLSGGADKMEDGPTHGLTRT